MKRKFLNLILDENHPSIEKHGFYKPEWYRGILQFSVVATVIVLSISTYIFISSN